MKKILFIIGTLDSGGVAKSIVNLLNAIDRKEQEVSEGFSTGDMLKKRSP